MATRIVDHVEFTEDWRGFADGERVEFRPGLNLVVGDQGSGKSSLLHAVQLKAAPGNRSHQQVPATLGLGPGAGAGVAVRRFDFERDNPRIQAAFGDNIAFQVSSMYMSHGEATRAILESIERPGPPALILLDEPDASLSPRSAHHLAALLHRLGDAGNQMIVSVHNPIVIAAAPDVLSLEHRRWMTSVEFLDLHDVA